VRRTILALLVAAVATPAAAALPPRHGVLAPGRSLGGLRLGMTPAQVRAGWGSDFGRCRGCARPTWYFTYRRYHSHGAAVQFRGGRVEAIFTLWAPSGWKTTKGLYIGDNVDRVPGLYGTLARADCPGNYYALTMPTPGGVNAIYVVNEKIFGFGLLSFRAPICR
jgi:hypothetical protein